MGYVDLDRQFLPLKAEESWEVEYTSFLNDSGRYWGCESWSEIIAYKRTVILAEAGAGKTAEMREKYKQLVLEDRVAFYLTVDDLAQNNIQDALALIDQDSIDRFEDWLAGSDEAIFLIDSVDEARLNNPKYFRNALSRISSGIRGHAARANILMSCRVSDWRKEVDQQLFREWLGAPSEAQNQLESVPIGKDDDVLLAAIYDEIRQQVTKSTEASPPNYEPHIVALAPLSIQQAKRLAEFNGVKDSNAFIEATKDSEAENLANRPQDLLSLSQFWKDKKTLGSKHEILQWSIQQRLRETNLDIEDKYTLDEDKAKKGAELVAAGISAWQEKSTLVAFGHSIKPGGCEITQPEGYPG